jgi:hypothetical protein
MSKCIFVRQSDPLERQPDVISWRDDAPGYTIEERIRSYVAGAVRKISNSPDVCPSESKRVRVTVTVEVEKLA